MVQFGTSGWRGIIGRDITFRKVRMVSRALLDVLSERGIDPTLVAIGYDTRMLSEKFALASARLMASEGVRVEITPRDVPSPVIAAMVRDRGATAGLTFTGSHNLPEYNGLKIYTADGIPAPDSYTEPIERRVVELAADWDDTLLPEPQLITSHDPKPAYLARLQDLIDWQAIRTSGLKLAVDPLFGTSRELLDHILLENDVPILVIHNTRDPYFGGYAPDCTSENLSRLRDVMRRQGVDLGLATDGDGDRFGVLDAGARMVDSSQVLALVLDYLARRRGLKGRVGRSIATSRLLDAVAADHSLELVETPVGFKSFGPLLLDGTLEYACEESAGLAWARHLPERDGILACLLVAEMVAVEGKTLAEMSSELAARVGAFAFRRTQMALSERTLEIYHERLGQSFKTFNGRTVRSVDRREGLRLEFEGGGWILVRLAGTEPKVRLYAEGRTHEEMRHLMHLARQLFSDRRF